MQLEEAIRLSIKKYYEGKLPEKLFDQYEEEGEPIKYTPEYFDALEDRIMNGEEPDFTDMEDEEYDEDA